MTEKEIQTILESLESFATFRTFPEMTDAQRAYWTGAAQALRDILCKLGYRSSIPDELDRKISNRGE